MHTPIHLIPNLADWRNIEIGNHWAEFYQLECVYFEVAVQITATRILIIKIILDRMTSN